MPLNELSAASSKSLADKVPHQTRGVNLLDAGLGAQKAAAWPVSDHFDGQRFHNPTLPKGFAPTVSSALGMMFEKRSRWPAMVKNAAVPLRVMCGVNDVAITFV